jgi:hypothetical protein
MATTRTPYQVAMTVCRNGHPYDSENTVITSAGRSCRTCKRESNRASYERNREVTIERARAWRLANPERARESARVSQRRVRAKRKAA